MNNIDMVFKVKFSDLNNLHTKPKFISTNKKNKIFKFAPNLNILFIIRISDIFKTKFIQIQRDF